MSKNKSKIKENLRNYVKNKSLSHRQFNISIGASDSFLKSDGGFNVDYLPIIRQKYPDLNINWLIYDEGKMILSANTPKKEVDISTHLSILGVNARVDELNEKLENFISQMFQMTEDKIEEAIKNKQI